MPRYTEGAKGPARQAPNGRPASAARSGGTTGVATTGGRSASGLLPSVSIPKGGGAMRGIGEKFATNPATGSGSMTVPIAVSTSRGRFGPELSLSYDSASGNGPFGFGWSLSVPRISRKTDDGLPTYLDAAESDVFLLSGAEDLVPVLLPDGRRHEDSTTTPGFTIHRYRPRVEGLFARIERWVEVATGDVHWRSVTRENVTTLYGRDGGSRIFDPGEGGAARPERVFEWLACESHDDKGNAIVYEYVGEDDAGIDLSRASERNRVRTANRYLKRILYGNRVSWLIQPELDPTCFLFEVLFDYGEGHHEEAPLDLGRPEREQHRFVHASTEASGRWAVRPDPFSTYRGGFEVRTYRRCHRVMVFHRFDELGPDPCLVRSTDFDYQDLSLDQPVTVEDELAHQGSTRFASFIRRVTQSGYVRDDSAATGHRDGSRFHTYLRKSLPPLEFEYSKARIQEKVRELDADSREHLPMGVDGATYQWVDLDGEGLSGILTQQAGAWMYKPNLGEGRFGPAQVLRTQPALFAQAGGGEQLLDLSGDGQLDVVSFDASTPGFHERTQDARWAPFRPFRSLPNVRWDEPNLRFVDLDGDGHADILITENDVMMWYPSLAEDGFGPARQVHPPRDEERGPRLVLADGTQSIYLADVSGDGLTDLVRIRNGEVCYWPNLGYGRFGAKVTMDNAPWFDAPDRFDQSRIRLADIDGSGVTDIIYLGRDGIRLYFNQSGNGWSEARYLPQLPLVDELSTLTTADLLGNGTACLVWSSSLPAARRSLRYIDLMGGKKPHLLVRSINNLGSETHVDYAPSTKFYLADKAAGRPWVTRLPFPVHVVERVETYDRVSKNHFVSRYTYHHGYFDGHEREFRGFGLVEQLDTEALGVLGGEGSAFPSGANTGPAAHVPPVLTRSWFHTGVYLGRDHVSDFFAGLLDELDPGEYFREPGLTDVQARELLLEDTALPDGLTLAEEREACRALKGALLRQEVYALDGSPQEPLPYVVTERNYIIKRLQARGDNRHAVFLTHPGEELVFNYERTLDPRVAHSITLEVDDFGNALKTASIGYGRRLANPGLSQPTQAEQARTHVIYAENRVTNGIDSAGVYRTPVVYDARTYELTGYVPSGPGGRFRREDLVGPATGAARFDDELEYQESPSSGRQRRLIEHSRTVFRRDDLSAALPLGQLQPLALPFEQYRLAFTPAFLTQVFGGRVDDAMLEGTGPTPGGRYVRLRDEGGALEPGWWIPSGQVFMSPGSTDGAEEELAYARAHFFLPCRSRDPFHAPGLSTDQFVQYDGYDLLIAETRDALGSRITVQQQDYRVLKPSLVMDPNRNQTALAYDALGLVVGTAVMGKPGEAPELGDRLTAAFRADLTEAEIDLFLADPRGQAARLLDDATTRVVCDLTRFWREPEPSKKPPVFVATLARETHASEPAPPGGPRIQIAFSYSDGFGREVQKKVPAEPGPVPARDAQGAVILGEDGQPRMAPGSVSPRWTTSGWTVFNNKGKPVRQYEPYFTDTHRFELDVRVGKSPILFYDPLSRVVGTLYPDHTWEKVVFGPWHQATWDASDTVLVDAPETDLDVGDFFARLPAAEYLPTWHARRRSGTLGPREASAARKSEVHAGTPTVAHADSLGRTIVTVTHNRFQRGGAPPVEERAETRVVLDARGNQRAVVDALGRVVVRYDRDMLGNRVHQASMESGERWMLNDVAGKPLYAWDSRGHRFRTAYDALQRPTETFVRDGDGPERLLGRSVYGESLPDPEARNLRGQLVELFEQSGVITHEAYDFKGNLLGSSRQLVREYRDTVDWSGPVAREAETYSSRTRYDALNRPTQLVAPHSDQAGSRINVIQPVYNEANLLERLDVWLDREALPDGLIDSVSTPPSPVGVANVDYDAKGQRVRLDYKNGVSTRYAYDPDTFRLRHLYTRRGAAFTDDCDNAQPPPTIAAPDAPPPGFSCGVQNLHYTYDPVGNITHIQDLAQQRVYFRNTRVDPDAEYTYDATFRLIEATGREHLGQAGGAPLPHSYNDAPRVGLLHPGDGNAMGRYVEQYFYDAAGNILSIRHRGSAPANPGWTRNYQYEEASQLEPDHPSNRLSRTSDATYSVEGDGYDAHGNMLHMPQLQELRWNERDQLRMTRRQAVNGDDADGVQRHGERTWYVYDSGGQRVRKVTELASGRVKDERLYLGGFEVHRVHGASPLVRETLHVMDDKQRIALVETRTQGSEANIAAQVVRYQLGNHLSSASLELDDRARVLSYEEYTPFGSTSYQAARGQTEAPKRYRYAGKERDDETGLAYYGGRYGMSWLGRWASFDPALLVDEYATRGSSEDPRGEESGPGAQDESGEPRDADGREDPRTARAGPMAHNGYCYALNNPVVLVDPDGWAPVPIGHIYVIRGTIAGEAVTYTGSTAQELMKRVGSRHKWNSLVTAEATTVTTYEVRAELSKVASGRGSWWSARNEALRAAEQTIMNRVQKEGATVLNEIRAATSENMAAWSARHKVSLGRAKLALRGGARVGAFAGFALLDLFNMYREAKMSQYVWAPYVLEDEGGQFTLSEERAHWFAHHYHWKNYIGGPKTGQKVEVDESEFDFWKREGELLWGTTDFWGDFVPGLLRPHLPVVEQPSRQGAYPGML